MNMMPQDPRERLEAALASLLRSSGQLRSTVEHLHAEIEATDYTEAARERSATMRAHHTARHEEQ